MLLVVNVKLLYVDIVVMFCLLNWRRCTFWCTFQYMNLTLWKVAFWVIYNYAAYNQELFQYEWNLCVIACFFASDRTVVRCCMFSTFNLGLFLLRSNYTKVEEEWGTQTITVRAVLFCFCFCRSWKFDNMAINVGYAVLLAAQTVQ